MYIVFDRKQDKWVVRERHLLCDDDKNLCFDLSDKADVERIVDILNEYEGEDFDE